MHSLTRLLLVATILTVATGCDKTNGKGTGDAEARAAGSPMAMRLDLSTKPGILFQVFGERDDPRLIPTAVLRDGAIQQIELDADGWRRFDSIYAQPASRYTLFKDGRAVGGLSVRRGMWPPAAPPLYSLPGCKTLTPLAAVTLDRNVAASYTVEFFASNVAIGRDASASSLSPAEAKFAGRELGSEVADGAGIRRAALDSLDFHAVAINTGATPQPTVIASFVEPSHDDERRGGGTAVHVFVIGDAGPTGGYAPSFRHALNGPAATAEYRRYVDHLDLTGDGIDEIIVEAWRYGGDSYPIVLSYRGAQWVESFRGRPSWCLDEKGES